MIGNKKMEIDFLFRLICQSIWKDNNEEIGKGKQIDLIIIHATVRKIRWFIVIEIMLYIRREGQLRRSSY